MIGIDGTGLTPRSRRLGARSTSSTHVRGGGPLPALRCGRQPYGLLPVTSLDAVAAAGRRGRRRTRRWPGCARCCCGCATTSGAARCARSPRLGRAARSARRRPRRSDAHGSGVVGLRHAPVGPPLPAAPARVHRRGPRTRLDPARRTRSPRGILRGSDFDGRPRAAPQRLRRPGLALARRWCRRARCRATAPLEPELHRRAARPSRRSTTSPPVHARADGGTLLQALLRHALLLRVRGRRRARSSRRTGTATAALLRDAELSIWSAARRPTLTWRRQLDQRVSARHRHRTIREHLEAPTGLRRQRRCARCANTAPRSPGCRGRDSETLQCLMQATLDLASHRLDAWVTSFATERLAAMRATAADRARASAATAGWRTCTGAASATPVRHRRPTRPAPLFAPLGDTGFIHAPSMAQAATAALLRNAHLGRRRHGRRPTGRWPSTCRRAACATARWLLDGVRRGQPLGALLGYRFERRLHDAQARRADRTLSPHRAARRPASSPPPTCRPRASPPTTSSTALRLIASGGRSIATACDGATLRRRGVTGRRSTTLSETIDAVGDALDRRSGLPGGARQRRRAWRARSTRSTKGEAPPPELDVARTPRTGTPLTHRVRAAVRRRAAGDARLAGARARRARTRRADAQRLGGAR